MPSLDMSGPYPLTAEAIDEYVAEGKIGNYALGVYGKNKLAIKYIGRSDTDLNKRLKEHIEEKGYTCFKFSCAESTVQAYQKECLNYHDFIDAGFRLDNTIHPAKPKNHPDDLRCPRCGR
jgi:hypothetical protein